MHGWEFRDIENNSTCEAAGTCSLGKIVRGPATAPIGRGSGYLAVGTSTTSRKMALVTSDLSGTRLADITSLHYSSYRNSGGPYAVPIVFDVDYDLTDSVPGSQGIMIFLPTYTDTSLSPQGIWVDWDPLTTGKWGGTANSASLIHLGVQSTVPNQCHIALRSFGSGPCTWDNLKTMYPNIGIAVGGRFGFYVQETWGTWNGVTPGMGDFQGNVDDLEIAVSGISTTIDFDPGAVPVFPPTFTPAGFADTTELVPIAGTDTTYVHRSILLLKFARAATQAARQAAVDSVQGIVVGGQPLFDADGFYYVAVPAGAGSDSVINAARKLRQFSQVSFAGPKLLLGGQFARVSQTEGRIKLAHVEAEPRLSWHRT